MIRHGTCLLALLLAACESQPSQQTESKASANPERYGRDRELCRGQVSEYTKTQRQIDDSRRATAQFFSRKTAWWCAGRRSRTFAIRLDALRTQSWSM